MTECALEDDYQFKTVDRKRWKIFLFGTLTLLELCV
jgi:hypothetical protein